jgi:hypothetical protein
VNAGEPRLAAGDLAARAELRACLRRVITWPWPQDMHTAVTCCRLALQHGTTLGEGQ